MRDFDQKCSLKEVLIVEDSPDLLELFSTILTEHGYQVRPFLSGKAALNSARKKRPDVILLDINLLDMSGYDVCSQLKTYNDTHDVPIIFCSSMDEHEAKIRAFTVGGSAYLTKPVAMDELVACVQTQLNGSQICRLPGKWSGTCS
jgi:DNA-binding response OmpR family regulator